MMMAHGRRKVLAAGLALALTGPAGAQSNAEWLKVVAAAKQEGKVVVYNAAIGAGYYREVARSFEQKYGVKVETLDVRASELSERVRTEQAAGRFLGDVEMHGEVTIGRQEQAGLLQAHGGIPNLKNLRPEFKAEGTRVPGYVQAYAILINTNLVKPAEEPKSWKDLLDPKWRGKILCDDMRALGGGQILFFVTQTAFGKDFHEKLAAQELVFSRDLVNDAFRIARGEYPIYIPLRLADATEIKPLPVKMILPAEGSPYVRIDLAMLKNAPHPNAARLFMNHFLEIEAQVVYGNSGQIPVVQGAADRVMPEMKPIASAKLLGTSNAEQQDAMLALAKQIYK